VSISDSRLFVLAYWNSKYVFAVCVILKRLKVRVGEPITELRSIWYHKVLPATRHRLTCPTLSPAVQAGTRFTYQDGWKTELTLVVGWLCMAYLSVDPSQY